MPIDPIWTPPSVSPGDAVLAETFAELAAPIDRRLRLVYEANAILPAVAPGLWIETHPLVRHQVHLGSTIPHSKRGVLQAEPPSPTGTAWLWPEDDGDLGKVIVPGPAGVGQVNLFQKVCGGPTWSGCDGPIDQWRVQAVHIEQVRRAVEIYRWGRWSFPLLYAGGILRSLPDEPWAGNIIGNDGNDELRSVLKLLMRTEPPTVWGLWEVEVLPASRIELWTSHDIQAGLHRVDHRFHSGSALPTWQAPWAVAGGVGGSDVTSITQLGCQADQWTPVSGGAVVQALQAMVDGAPQSMLLCRADQGPQTVAIAGRAVVEFAVTVPN